MKLLALLPFILLGTMSTALPAAARDDRGHELVRLWTAYRKAADADRPGEQAVILEQIKQEAAAKRLAWDYYDACRTYVEVRCLSDWKLREELTAQADEEIERYGEPVAVYFRRKDTQDAAALLAYVREQRSRLVRAHNPEFYAHDAGLVRLRGFDALLPLLADDWEFVLWSLYGGHALPETAEAVRAQFAGRYPFDALFEYYEIRRGSAEGRDEALEAYVMRQGGRATALPAREDLLLRRREQLDKEGGSSEQYRRLADDCRALIAAIKGCSGTEKTIADACTAVAPLLEMLCAESVTVAVEQGRATLSVRNLSSVQLSISDGKKTVWERRLDNPAGSFYRADTLRIDLPEIEDKRYTLRCSGGKAKVETEYEKYTLSIAHKRDHHGYGVYVADYLTGQPVRSCDLHLSDRNGDRILTVQNLVIDGFTYLPDSLSARLGEDRRGLALQAETVIDGRIRRSQRHVIRAWEPEPVRSDNPVRHHALLLTDRRVFSPDETVHYKAILYDGTYEYAARPAGIALTAVLTDPEGRQIGQQALTTGEFGSAAGAFVLRKGERGGLYRISIREGDTVLAATSVRADELVLPAFVLDWKDDDRFYLPGDEVLLEGTLHSYSGHALSGAKAVYTVRDRGTVIGGGTLPLMQTGGFRLQFRIPEDDVPYHHCTVNVRVTDATGETLEFDRAVSASAHLPLDIRILNRAAGHFERPDRYDSGVIVGEDRILARIQLGGIRQVHPGLRLEYRLLHGTAPLFTGAAENGAELSFDLGGRPSGHYVLEVTATVTGDNGREVREVGRQEILKVADGDTALDFDASCFFKEIADAGGIALQVGAATGPVWIAAELYGDGNRLIEKRMVRLAGIRGRDGSLGVIRFARKDDDPEELTLKVFWFRDGRSHEYAVSSRKVREPHLLPLHFSRFLDTTAPRRDYSFTIRTAADTEIAATIFDKSTETLGPNVWSAVSPARRSLPAVRYGSTPGTDSAFGSGDRHFLPVSARAMALTKTMNAAMPDTVSEAAIEYEDAALAGDAGAGEVLIRENFANTIAWEPFLRSDGDGLAEFRFSTADKLSTYYVQLFAHDKAFHNAVLRRELVVTLPVRVALVQPQFLYEGDRYAARVSVSNSSDKAVSGRISVRFLDGTDYRDAPELGGGERAVTVPAGGSAEFVCETAAPRIRDLGLLVAFSADDAEYGSDGVFVTVPVAPAVQRITEAHSALLTVDTDRDTLLASLRGQFVNIPAAEAVLREISILDMIREAIPEKILPDSEDLLSQSEALFANFLLDCLPGAAMPGASAEERSRMTAGILACRDGDGAYSWFPGLSPSPVLTAVLLERLAAMGADCPAELAATLPDAVRWLDEDFCGTRVRPLWCGGLSLAQYLHVRALYPEIPFAPRGADRKTVRTFRKAAKAYLVPGSVRGLNGRVLEKARRIQTLRTLLSDENGRALARSWGISLSAGTRLRRSLDRDIASLLQYAQAHRSGGICYPNAVLPWRGLLESELYAHALICDLLADCGHGEVAEGIRLWMMVQKETQQWADDPAYLQAIASVLHGSETTLQTRVLALSASAALPFEEVRAAGNGFAVSRSFTRDGRPLAAGDTLHLGDKITATYTLRSEENRSFVHLNAPHPAALRPVEQRSGPYGLQVRPISVTGWGSFTPLGYRSVRANRTEYWFDSYPEQTTTLVEEYFVTQEGSFQCPAPVIESRYAPHYRANDAGTGPVTVRAD